MWSHGVVEHLLCEVMCLGVRDGAAETLLTGVKVVPETMYLGKSSIGGDIAHIGDYLCLFVFIILYVSSAFLPPPLGDLARYVGCAHGARANLAGCTGHQIQSRIPRLPKKHMCTARALPPVQAKVVAT